MTKKAQAEKAEAPQRKAATSEEPQRLSDQEREDIRQSELAAAHDEHNRRTGGGQYHPDAPGNRTNS